MCCNYKPSLPCPPPSKKVSNFQINVAFFKMEQQYHDLMIVKFFEVRPKVLKLFMTLTFFCNYTNCYYPTKVEDEISINWVYRVSLQIWCAHVLMSPQYCFFPAYSLLISSNAPLLFPPNNCAHIHKTRITTGWFFRL